MNHPAKVIFSMLVSALSSAGPSRVAAAEGLPASTGPLVFRGCDPNERLEVARLVSLDLASSETKPRPPAGSMAVTCQEGRFDIAVTPAPGQTLTRSIDLRQLPAHARPRIVAIAAVELFAADPAETAQPAVPSAAPAVGIPEAPKTCCRLHLVVVAAGRTFRGETPRLLGAGVRAETARGRLAFDALGEFGSASTIEGTARALSLSSSATAGWSTAPGVLTWGMGAGVRAGLLRLSGDSTDPSLWSGRTAWRGWGGPKVEARLAMRPSRAAVALLTVEGGYALVSVYGLGTAGREVALRGVWVGLQLGIGLGF